jgi:uncharacterized damage-inducible protein DinB
MNPVVSEIVRNTRMSAYFLTQSAESMPDEKFDWVVGEKSRSARQLVQELIVFPDWIKNCINAGGMGAFPERSEFPADRAALMAEFQRVTDEFCAYIEGMDAASLAKSTPMPWNPDATAMGLLGYHEWNNTYHLGQLNFIQTCYGDEEMHM